VKYGFILMGNPAEVIELAQEAEAAGWDGVLLPDDWMNAWIKLTAIAMCVDPGKLASYLETSAYHKRVSESALGGWPTWRLKDAQL
jgi:hypothetical protein